jgi:hypothetical protein
MLIGMDNDIDLDGDGVPDGDSSFENGITGIAGLKVITLRGALAFFSIGGWAAFLLDGVTWWWLAAIIGVVIGAIAAVAVAILFKLIMKLESSGNIEYNNAIGLTGEVYIRVPHNRIGKGKVTLVVQERYLECDALTDDDVDLLHHTQVTVVGVENLSTLVVKRVEK